MAIGDQRYPFAARTAWGYPFMLLQNVIEYVGAYTHHKKKISAATAGAVLGSTAGTTSKQTITAGITNPDVPRVLAITIGGSGYSADNILINGINVEGKPITDTIAYSANGQVLGSLVFKRVTSVVIPSTAGTSMTLTVDTTARIGLNHRTIPNKTAFVDVYASNTAVTSVTAVRPTLDGNITGSNSDNEFVEKNWITTSTAPNGTYFYFFFYWYTKVLVYPPKDSPEFYSTTTSTSTSTSSTSTSSTSISTSTSISSTSISTTSISTSSTSTSTTTLPV